MAVVFPLCPCCHVEGMLWLSGRGESLTTWSSALLLALHSSHPKMVTILFTSAMRLGTSAGSVYGSWFSKVGQSLPRLYSLFPLTFCLGNKVLCCGQKLIVGLHMSRPSPPNQMGLSLDPISRWLDFLPGREGLVCADVSLWMNPLQASRLGGSRSHHRGT